MTITETVEMRGFGSRDLDRVVDLFDVVWPTAEGHRERTHWAFGANPVGTVPLVGAFDTETGAMVGVRGGIRWPLAGGVPGDALTAIQLHGTCVHPEYRRMRLFTRMCEEFVRQARDSGFDVIFNVSVAASRAGYERLGWRYLPGFRAYHRIERLGSVVRRLARRGSPGAQAGSRVPESSRPAFGEVREFIDRRDSLLGELAHTAYPEDFFGWRFSHSTHRIAGSADVGYCAYRVRTVGGLRDVLFGDLWPAPRRAAALIAAVVDAERADTSTIWMSGTHPLRGTLLRHGFIPDLRRSLHFGVKTLSGRAEALVAPSRWGCVSADIDTF
ncbi:GNAT family N-acetyltransferase [Krasilnikovia sp. MM14-A1259]|uniref:GNAT family N-acetyltransferase n=1 Tax=Krasilnikovia sp. MM14-A1259 TaxID=3373539 RepID=UPI0038221897